MMSRPFGEMAAVWLARVREQQPLIHHITNYVTMNDVANVTRALGALPVMAHAPEEVEDMVASADALVLNTGTPTAARVEVMRLAGQAAERRGVPIILDPVGAGATPWRTRINRDLLDEVRVRVVRGNPGEIAALLGREHRVRGVENGGGAANVPALVCEAAQTWQAVVAATGRHDVISDGERLFRVENGHPWLATFSGSGCMATAVVAAFVAVADDAGLATTLALAVYGLAAERAALHAVGPMSFKVALLDRLHALTADDLTRGVRVVEVSSFGNR